MNFHAFPVFIRRTIVIAWVGIAALAGSTSSAQSILDEISTTGDSSAVGVVERTLTVTTAGNHDITLTDLALPAALVGVRAAITRGTTVVQTLEIAAGTPGPAVTRRVDLAAGSYSVRVVGTPTTADRSGSASVSVVRASDAAQVLAFSEAFSLAPAVTPANQRTFQRSFTIGDTASYTVTLSDLGLPQAAQTVTLLLTRGSTPVGTPLAAARSFVFTGAPQGSGETLQQATYTLRVAAAANTTAAGALLNVRVRSAAGTNVVDEAIAVGQVRRAGAVTLAAGAHTLRLTDLAFPAALGTRQAVGVADGLAAVRATTTGDTPFTAAAGSYQFFVLARPAAEPGTGSYALDVLQGTGSVFTAAEAVSVGAVTTPAFTFVADVPSAGNYQLRLADFQFPNAFTSLRVIATQGGAALGTLAAVGNADLTAVRAGRLYVLALAQSSTTTTGGGVFGIELVPAAGGAAVFDVNQGAGALFVPRRFTIATAGRYDVAVRDLGFPANFIELFALVTRGPTRVGSIFGGGTFSFDATPGTYFINFVARPDLVQKAGTYGINVAPSPPAPTLTLSANPTSVASGSTTALTWSSTNATSCTASGGWTGSRATSGTETSAAVTASTTYTLNCSGAGGSVSQSVSITIATPVASGGGGGGRLDALFLLALLGAAGLAARRERPILR